MKHLVIVRHANPLSPEDSFSIVEALGRIGKTSPASEEDPQVTKWVVEHAHDPDAAAIALNAAATKASWAVDSVTVTPYVVRSTEQQPVSETRRAFRTGFTDAISAYSEEHFAAGWLIGIEDEIRTKAVTEPYFAVLAYLAGGFPRYVENSNPAGPFEDSLVWDDLTDDERARGAAIVAELTDSRTDPNS